MSKDDVELLDDDEKIDLSEIKPIAPIDIDITKPIEIIGEIDDEDNKPTLIDPDAVLKSVAKSSPVKEKIEEGQKETPTPAAKMISPEDVVTQIGKKNPQMISPEDVIAQIGSTRTQAPSKTIVNVQKKLEQVEGINNINTNESKKTATATSKSNIPITGYANPSYDEERNRKINSYKNVNKDYRITLLFVAVVILFSLGIITSLFDTSSAKKTSKSKNKIETTTNIIENDNGNSYFFAPLNNKVKSGTSNETTYYLLGDEKSGQTEIFNILEKKYMTEGSNIENGQYDNLIEIGPIKDDKSVNIVLPTNYNKLNERIIKSTNKDGSIIVIKYSNGISKKVEEHLRLMNQLGAEKTIIFINIDEDSKDANELIKEIKKLLKDTGYDENTPIIVGKSKDEESVAKLYEAMTKWIRIVPSNTEKPLRAHINNVVQNKKSVRVNLQIESGTIKVGEKIKLLGKEYSQIETVSEIYVNDESKETTSESNEYDEIYVVLNTNYDKLMNSASELVSENSDDIYYKFYALFYFSDDNNNKTRSFNNNYSTDIQLKNSINGKITIPKGINFISKNDTTSLVIELSERIPIYKGQKFTINDQINDIFGYGEVVGIIE